MQKKRHISVGLSISLVLFLSFIGTSQPLFAQDAVPLNAISDIASCGSDGDEAVGALLDTLDGWVISPGDNSQHEGSAEYYQNCYEPNFGRHKWRLFPVPGNHDMFQQSLDGYYAYFGANAGNYGEGYYALDYGSWRIIALNSMSDLQPGSTQYSWLANQLAANTRLCTLVFVHHPRFHSGVGNLSRRVRAAFELMYDANVDVLVSGDAHHYERFAPMNPQGRLDVERGIRQFVVGTGGASHTPLNRAWSTTEARDNTTFGVTRFMLGNSEYSWQFIPASGGTFTDHGAWKCH